MMQDGQITPTATILTWTESTMVLISVIASLVAGCHLCSKHRGNMRKLGIALVPVFIAWLLCSNLLPAAVFYLAGNTRQTAFISMNLISMITTTSAYIYAYYRMFRAIKTKYFGDAAFFSSEIISIRNHIPIILYTPPAHIPCDNDESY